MHVKRHLKAKNNTKNTKIRYFFYTTAENTTNYSDYTNFKYKSLWTFKCIFKTIVKSISKFLLALCLQN